MYLDNFKIEADHILGELEAAYESKRRQIDNCFQIMYDNIPKEIRDIPLNETFQQLIYLVRHQLMERVSESHGEETDQAVTDTDEATTDELTSFNDEIK